MNATKSMTHITQEIVNLVSDDSPPRFPDRASYIRSAERVSIATLEKRLMENNARIAALEIEMDQQRKKSADTDKEILKLQESIGVLIANNPVQVPWSKDEFHAFAGKHTPPEQIAMNDNSPPRLMLRSGSIVRPSPVYDVVPRLPPPAPTQLAPRQLNFGPPRMTAAQAAVHQMNNTAAGAHLVFPLGSPNKARFIKESRSKDRSILNFGLQEEILDFDD